VAWVAAALMPAVALASEQGDATFRGIHCQPSVPPADGGDWALVELTVRPDWRIKSFQILQTPKSAPLFHALRGRLRSTYGDMDLDLPARAGLQSDTTITRACRELRADEPAPMRTEPERLEVPHPLQKCPAPAPTLPGARAAVAVALRPDGAVERVDVLKAEPSSFGPVAQAWAATCSFTGPGSIGGPGKPRLTLFVGAEAGKPALILRGMPAPRPQCAPPKMPEEAAAAGLNGLVLVDYVIEPDGEVFLVNLKKTPASPVLYDAVVRWLHGCRFGPIPTMNGKPFRVKMVTPFNFSVRD